MLRSLCGIACLVAASLFVPVGGSAPSARADALPPRPVQGVSDTAKVLRLSLVKAIERLLAEHESLTNETIFVLTVARTPSGEEMNEYAAHVFDDWKTSVPKPPSAVLLLFDLDARKLVWRAGVGIDPLLIDRGADSLQKSIAGPELSHDRADRAVVLTVRKVFEMLESPVLVNGKFDSELREAGFYEDFTPVAAKRGGWGAWIWVVLGALATGTALYRILSVEVHYTASGWRRIPASEIFLRFLLRAKRKVRPLVSGGGVSGGY